MRRAPVLAFQEALANVFGRMRRWQVLHQDEDRAQATARFENADVLVEMVAIRDDDGVAHTAVVLVGIGEPCDQ